MVTRPPVSDAELAVILGRVVRRRRQIDDPDLAQLPDDTDHATVGEVVAVLDYLASHSRVPDWVGRADVFDALRLNNYLWWQERRRELTWLRAGVQRRVFLSQLGAAVGVGKQGVRDRIDRLDALLRYQRPDEQLTRQARAVSRNTTAPLVQTAWLESRTDDLCALANRLNDAATTLDLPEEDRAWIDELAADARSREFSVASMAMLALAVDELRTASALTGSQDLRPTAIHRDLELADQLRSQFAALGTK